MKSDSKNNPSPIAPTSAEPSNASSVHPKYTKAPEKGTLVKKTGNAKGATDPYKQAKPSRKFIKKATGAAYGIKVSMPSYTSPEAGATQSNGRLFQAAVKRTAPNFRAGVDSQS
jgi:hypothetical protein